LTFRIIHADGTIRWLEHVCQPIVDDSATFLGTRGCNRNITRRMETEEELLLMRLCVDKAAIGIWLVVEGGAILSVNEHACRTLGYTREELCSLNIFDVDPAMTIEKVEQLLTTLTRHGFVTHETVHRKKDGTVIPVEVTTNNVEFNGKIYPFSFVKDISERKEAETRLARSEQKFRAVFEGALDAIFLMSKEAVYLDCNPAACVLFACCKGDIIEKNPRLFSPPFQPDGVDTREKASEVVAGVLAGRSQSFEWRHLRADGAEFDSVVALSSLELEGEPLLVAIVRDITQRKSLEEQLYQSQKMEAVGQLAGGIAHDFNNILTAMFGYVHLLNVRMSQDDPFRRHINQIDDLVKRAAELTSGLLAFSRKQVMVRNHVDLNETITGLLRMLKRLFKANIELRVEISPERIIVLADRGKLEQVIMNLVTNARDAIAAGGTIIIRTSVGAAHGGIQTGGMPDPACNYACIAVSDTGCGMDEDTKRKIFEPFFTTKEVGRGTGLGLAIVYGIVKQHNGFIHVDSEPGRGTEFRIFLPLANIPEMRERSMSGQCTFPPGGSETILLAEDDSTLNQLYRELLEEMGYGVIAAADGEEAVEAFKKQGDGIALLILDVVMPKLNGKGVLDCARAARPDIKALFLSGYSADVLQEDDIHCGEVEILMKPITPNELLGKVREMLDGREGGK
jgi:PAS domain S-box-containing protein